MGNGQFYQSQGKAAALRPNRPIYSSERGLDTKWYKNSDHESTAKKTDSADACSDDTTLLELEKDVCARVAAYQRAWLCSYGCLSPACICFNGICCSTVCLQRLPYCSVYYSIQRRSRSISKCLQIGISMHVLRVPRGEGCPCSSADPSRAHTAL